MKHDLRLQRTVTELLLARPNLTRQDILREMPLRPATLCAAVQNLIHAGLVEEPERKGFKTGRRPSPLRLCGGYGCFLGVELDIHETMGVCIDAAGTTLAVARVASGVRPRDINVAKADVGAVISDLRHQLAGGAPPVRGIGFADPGLVDTRHGTAIKAVNIAGWENVPVTEWLHAEFGGDGMVLPAVSAQAYA